MNTDNQNFSRAVFCQEKQWNYKKYTISLCHGNIFSACLLRTHKPYPMPPKCFLYHIILLIIQAASPGSEGKKQYVTGPCIQNSHCWKMPKIWNDEHGTKLKTGAMKMWQSRQGKSWTSELHLRVSHGLLRKSTSVTIFLLNSQGRASKLPVYLQHFL